MVKRQGGLLTKLLHRKTKTHSIKSKTCFHTNDMYESELWVVIVVAIVIPIVIIVVVAIVVSTEVPIARVLRVALESFVEPST